MPITTSMPSTMSATASLAQATSRLHSLAAASLRACPCRRRTSPSTRRTDPAHGACAGRTAFFVQSQQHEAGPSDRSIVVVVTLSHNTHRPAPAGGTSSGEDGGSGTGDAVAHALRLRTGVIARNKPTAGDERHCTGGGGAGEAAGTTFGEDLMADGALMGRNNRRECAKVVHFSTIKTVPTSEPTNMYALI